MRAGVQEGILVWKANTEVLNLPLAGSVSLSSEHNIITW